ncbi:unnamed protein product [Allacma fusca]|uniref:Uncharacterized protein n=1 Tax=Allacma fusca TaxID=39272 RepID=A0A8J2LEZ6_9HEXA|nr:unnamed protein product [Allacma fusca]
MQVILRKFSRLERLELNSKFGFHESVLTGSGFGSVINVRNYWRNGFNWSCGDDNLTLASLTHLKHLRLEHGWNSAENPDYEFFPVTNRGIRDGISKIPALDTLRLTWTPKLSAAALGEYLKNVRTIMVDITTGTNYDSDTCLQLRLLWPQVKILRARHKCVNVSWMSKILGWVRSFLWLDE